MVRRLHDRAFVLNDDECVALVAERAHHTDKAVDVARMQADGRFVENEERAGERGAEATGEVHAFDLAAG